MQLLQMLQHLVLTGMANAPHHAAAGQTEFLPQPAQPAELAGQSKRRLGPLGHQFAGVQRQAQIVSVTFQQHGDGLQVVGGQRREGHAANGHKANGLAGAAHQRRDGDQLFAFGNLQQRVLQMDLVAGFQSPLDHWIVGRGIQHAAR